MFRWIIYILRGLPNLLGEPMYSTRCQVCDGEGENRRGLVPGLPGKDMAPYGRTAAGSQGLERWQETLLGAVQRGWFVRNNHHDIQSDGYWIRNIQVGNALPGICQQPVDTGSPLHRGKRGVGT